MNFDFENKTVIVTGGTGALGVSIVNTFINANAKVIATYRDEQQAKSFWLNVPDSKNKVSLVKCELTNQQDVDNLLIKASSLGQLRALINAAGGYRYGLIEETEEPVLNSLLDYNLKTTYLTSRSAIPFLRKSQLGSIVNVGAKSGITGEKGNGPYGISKAGVLLLTQVLDAELKRYGINVNAVLPSIIDTKANREMMPNSDFSRWVRPTDIANLILFLASDYARAIHGAGVPISGEI